MLKELGTACVMFAQSKQLIGCEQAATNKQQTRASNQQPTNKQETRNNKQQPPTNKQQTRTNNQQTNNLLVLSFPAAALAKSRLECMKCPLMLSIAVHRSPQLHLFRGTWKPGTIFGGESNGGTPPITFSKVKSQMICESLKITSSLKMGLFLFVFVVVHLPVISKFSCFLSIFEYI